jgi:hypothetical protein
MIKGMLSKITIMEDMPMARACVFAARQAAFSGMEKGL